MEIIAWYVCLAILFGVLALPGVSLFCVGRRDSFQALEITGIVLSSVALVIVVGGVAAYTSEIRKKGCLSGDTVLCWLPGAIVVGFLGAVFLGCGIGYAKNPF